uniref:NADH dehydrogenase subunit 6 n=1 Tax=Elaphrothrips spiniceps TaxID=3003602 RepID=A0AA50QY92_9NEOP|nr:NADH dehydrogenase subunit 6 [Elaphrothrips spiniceps]
MYDMFYTNMMILVVFYLMMFFFFSFHPLILGLILILLTFILSSLNFVFFNNSWSGYIMFLMFLGGLLILFLYNISMIETELFPTNFIKMIKSWWWLFFLFLFSLKESFSAEKNLFSLLKDDYMNLFIMFKYWFNVITFVFLIFYLFFCLICVINVVYLNKDKGSLWTN